MDPTKQAAIDLAVSLYGQGASTFRTKLATAINTLNEIAGLHDQSTADSTTTVTTTQIFYDQRDALLIQRFTEWLAEQE